MYVSREGVIVIQYFKCLIGLHKVLEIHRCKDGELTVCHHCLKVFQSN